MVACFVLAGSMTSTPRSIASTAPPPVGAAEPQTDMNVARGGDGRITQPAVWRYDRWQTDRRRPRYGNRPSYRMPYRSYDRRGYAYRYRPAYPTYAWRRPPHWQPNDRRQSWSWYGDREAGEFRRWYAPAPREWKPQPDRWFGRRSIAAPHIREL
jgi:hypothetical protein